MEEKVKYLMIIGAVLLPLLYIGGCADTDKISIGQAQFCLNKVDESNLSAIADCLGKLGNIDTQEANVVRCSGETLLGGLTSDKVLNAFANSGSSQAALMMTLAVSNQGSLSLNKNRASETLTSCSKSGVAGLIALASFSNIGTQMTSLGTCGNPDACLPGEADGFASSCAGAGTTCDPEEVGVTAVVVAEVYCTGDNATTPECQDILNAVNTGGSNAGIGQLLLGNLGSP